MATKQATTYSALLGTVLSNLRKQQGIEQGDMAEKMGLSQASYSRLEGGKSAFTLDQMYQAASALNMTGTQIIEEIDNYSSYLRKNEINVIPQVRGNTTQASKNENTTTTLIAGAVLGAALMAILSRK